MSETRDSIEIDLRRMFLVLWSNLWIILLVAVLIGAMLFSYAWFFVEPTYSASVQLYVNNNYENSPGFSSSQLTAAQSLAGTYIVIMKSRSVLDEVATQTNLGYSYGRLRSMISAAPVDDTEIFQVTVTCTNYKHAAQIANAIAKVLPDKITAVVEASSVRVVDYAVENPNPVGPSYTSYALIGFVLGFVLSAAVFVVMAMMDTRINSEEYLTNVYKEYPLLAVVPGAESSKSGYYKGYYESPGKKRKAVKKTGGAK